MIFFFVSDFPVADGAADVAGGVAGPRTWRKRSTSSSNANFSFSCFTSSNSLSRSCCFLSEGEELVRRRGIESNARIAEFAATVENRNLPVGVWTWISAWIFAT